MNDSISKIVVGASGVAASEVAQQAMVVVPTDINGIVNLVVQIAIGLVTLFGLFKKRKK